MIDSLLYSLKSILSFHTRVSRSETMKIMLRKIAQGKHFKHRHRRILLSATFSQLATARCTRVGSLARSLSDLNKYDDARIGYTPDARIDSRGCINQLRSDLHSFPSRLRQTYSERERERE